MAKAPDGAGNRADEIWAVADIDILKRRSKSNSSFESGGHYGKEDDAKRPGHADRQTEADRSKLCMRHMAIHSLPLWPLQVIEHYDGV